MSARRKWRPNQTIITWNCECGMTTRGTRPALEESFWCLGCGRGFESHRRWGYGEDSFTGREHPDQADVS